MSELKIALEKARERQIRVRYAKHYLNGSFFTVEGMYPELVQINIKPHEAIELIGDLTKFVLNSMKMEDEDA